MRRRRETIGQRLFRLRLERGLSQRELASPGVSYAYISRIEAGTRNPSVKALRKLASKLGVTADYLETGVDEVVARAPVDLIDSGAEQWGVPFGWHDLTDDERAHVLHDLDHALLDAVVARIHVIKLNRDQEEATT